MATEFKLPYTAAEVNQRLAAVDDIANEISELKNSDIYNKIPLVASPSAPDDTSVFWVDTTDDSDTYKQLTLDLSLSVTGCAADAKATGDEIAKIKEDAAAVNKLVNDINSSVSSNSKSISSLESLINASAKIHVGDTAPTDVVDGMVWFDTSEE